MVCFVLFCFCYCFVLFFGMFSGFVLFGLRFPTTNIGRLGQAGRLGVIGNNSNINDNTR